MEEVKQGRDFEQEVRQLYEEHPDLRGEELPEDVVKAVVEGKNLSEAYKDYTTQEEKQREEQEKRRAPVKGVTRGGSVDTQPEDIFLRGFSQAW